MSKKPVKLFHSAKFYRNCFALLILLLLISGYGVYAAPNDYVQGGVAKIMYIHIPAAWAAQLIFLTMAVFAGLFLIFRNPVYDMLCASMALPGLFFALTVLLTGSLWGKPTWGTYWVWDARLTSMFLQLWIYFIYIVIRNAIRSKERRARASALFVLFALINIPIIKLSVYLWNTLHQQSSLFNRAGLQMDMAIFWPLIPSALSVLLLTVLLTGLDFRNRTLHSTVMRKQL